MCLCLYKDSTSVGMDLFWVQEACGLLFYYWYYWQSYLSTVRILPRKAGSSGPPDSLPRCVSSLSRMNSVDQDSSATPHLFTPLLHRYSNNVSTEIMYHCVVKWQSGWLLRRFC